MHGLLESKVMEEVQGEGIRELDANTKEMNSLKNISLSPLDCRELKFLKPSSGVKPFELRRCEGSWWLNLAF